MSSFDQSGTSTAGNAEKEHLLASLAKAMVIIEDLPEARHAEQWVREETAPPELRPSLAGRPWDWSLLVAAPIGLALAFVTYFPAIYISMIVIAMIVTVAETDTPPESSWFLMALVIALLIGGLAAFLVWTLLHRRIVKAKKAFDAKYAQQMAHFESVSEEIRQRELVEFPKRQKAARDHHLALSRKYREHVVPLLPSEFRGTQQLSYLYKVIDEGRATNLNEAMSMYEEKAHRDRVESNQATTSARLDAMAEIQARQQEQIMLSYYD